MVKDAAPPGQIGKVFGFVSAGLALGGAIMPVPYGMLIDAGQPDLVLVVVAALWLVSLLFVGSARGHPPPRPPPCRCQPNNPRLPLRFPDCACRGAE